MVFEFGDDMPKCNCIVRVNLTSSGSFIRYWLLISDDIVECNTGWARLIRSHSSARFSFELSGNSNYIIHCNSNYVQNFELEINSI